MSESAYKALYEAQRSEHEVTHLRLREAEKVINVLRGEVLMSQMERERAVHMLQRIAVNIDEVYSPRQQCKEGIAMFDPCEDLAPPTVFEEGILFVAGATVALGALTAATHVWNTMFRRQDGKERGR